MEWTLTILFVVSILLLIFSILKERQTAKKNHKEIDLVHISVMKEINGMQESLRNMEIDLEIVTKETGVQLSTEEKVLKREVLDLYRRQYSIDSIAQQKQVSENEVKQIIAVYQSSQAEGRLVANEG
ncbi:MULTISPECIES: hypothetical protein [Neobacillus]|uniref:Uncharacterized protein n=1 Tax=Neobacillus citreus TaxID=2833578 RepID=A0A942Y5V4_9BACI|nr:hypothetical protein [Neobacillus citreus]MCH6265409.1 hypothetical protein [Neobacillus citreus]